MTTATNLLLLELWYEALNSPFGVIVHTADGVERLRQRMYKVREGNPDLQGLSLVVSPTNPDTEIWIVKAKPNVTPETA